LSVVSITNDRTGRLRRIYNRAEANEYRLAAMGVRRVDETVPICAEGVSDTIDIGPCLDNTGPGTEWFAPMPYDGY